MSGTNRNDTDRVVRLTCVRDRSHSWQAVPLDGVPVSEWTAHLESQACPECGTLYRVTSQHEEEGETGERVS